jgi:antitoxin component YwqK of YwqJK toxin-antitoxin module
MIKSIFIFCLLYFSLQSSEKTYQKTYFENGKMESEGWIDQNQKVDYWFYYYENGNKKAEGHYEQNKKCKWWIFYKSNKEIDKKSEFENDQLNGFTLIYKKNNIIRAEKYTMGKKLKEWNSLSEFKKDNKISF